MKKEDFFKIKIKIQILKYAQNEKRFAFLNFKFKKQILKKSLKLPESFKVYKANTDRISF